MARQDVEEVENRDTHKGKVHAKRIWLTTLAVAEETQDPQSSYTTTCAPLMKIDRYRDHSGL